jgi:hypothetical protein
MLQPDKKRQAKITTLTIHIKLRRKEITTVLILSFFIYLLYSVIFKKLAVNNSPPDMKWEYKNLTILP